tara:strand:- start:3223 stop:3834 length:612 start_codon:yes stop_codon:yes gene_type:complete
MSDDKKDIVNKVIEWCSQNIKYLVIGVLLGIAIPLSMSYYQNLLSKRNIIASDLYYKISNIENPEEILIAAEQEISSDHSNSVYAVLSKFVLAKNAFDKKNYSLAKEYLEEITESDIDDTYNSLAKIKLSIICIQEQNYDQAIEYLDDIELKESFKQVVAETKGDIYKFKGDKNMSLKYYNEAVEASAINNENLLMKRNAVKN